MEPTPRSTIAWPTASSPPGGSTFDQDGVTYTSDSIVFARQGGLAGGGQQGDGCQGQGDCASVHPCRLRVSQNFV